VVRATTTTKKGKSYRSMGENCWRRDPESTEQTHSTTGKGTWHPDSLLRVPVTA
jgi:hypothetical protein